jgi:hypothetical protein
MSAGKFGDPYAVTPLADMTLPGEVVAGLALCSHNPDVVERAVFSNVRVIRPAAGDFRPYRDYIGSVLELIDVATGARRVLKTSQDPFEAPNWTRDGGSLIYNTSGTAADTRGRLVRYDLATGRTATIDTATNTRNNNDHVLSFDGAMLGISDQSQPGGSAVYTVPLAGGTPKRITANTPSYMHSWSPDGKTLIYTGGRNGEFDIFAMKSDGSGSERNLTNSKGLDDGPEYSPDGKFVYFNSVRSGSMQIWRMKPDGADPVQITNDEWNNWFPHISPDGQTIAFISFPKEVDPADHPYYKQVMLRLMPAARRARSRTSTAGRAPSTCRRGRPTAACWRSSVTRARSSDTATAARADTKITKATKRTKTFGFAGSNLRRQTEEHRVLRVLGGLRAGA